MITLSKVNKIIKRNEILTDISFNFEKGKAYKIEGHNGSGKTMLLKTISGFLKPTEGSVVYNGQKLYTDIDFYESIGISIFKDDFIRNLTAKDNLELLVKLTNNKVEEKEIDNLIEMFHIPKLKKYKEFSLGMGQWGGNQERFVCAMALNQWCGT